MNIVINAQTGEKTFVQETAEELARYEAERAEYNSTVLPELMRQQRAAAYRSEADPLFFKAQRGEATTDEWTAKVAEIKARFPYPGADE